MADGPSSLHTLAGVSPLVKAYASCDLDSHVAFIRRALAKGMTCKAVGDALGGVSASRINKYARKHRMVRNLPRGFHSL